MFKPFTYCVQNESFTIKWILMFFILWCLTLINNFVHGLFINNAIFEFGFLQKEMPILAIIKTPYDIILFVKIFNDWGALIIIISLIIIAFALYYNNYIKHCLIKSLQEKKAEINRQKHELESKNIELLALNERLHELNHYLENKVTEGDLLLENKNQKIIEYAFITAHKLRAPLARILGIVHLIQLSPKKEIDETLLHYLQVSAEDLDKIIHQVQNVLDEEN